MFVTGKRKMCKLSQLKWENECDYRGSSAMLSGPTADGEKLFQKDISATPTPKKTTNDYSTSIIL